MGEVSGWSSGTLGDFITLKRGYDLPKSKRKAGIVPIISSSGPSGFHDEAKAQSPGVVTGRYGTIGQVFLIDLPFWPLNTSLYVSDFKGVEPAYAAALLQTINWNAYDGKSGVPGINRNDVHQAQVAVPPLPEQRAIADVLGALDDKIESNRLLTIALEGAAQQQFTALSGGPVEGETPLTHVTDVVPGRSYKSIELAVESEIALVSLKCIAAGGGFTPAGLKAYDGPFKPAQVVRPTDILVAVTDLTQAANVVGHPAVVNADNDFDQLVASLDLVIVRPHEDRWAPFVLGVLQSKAWIRHARSYANGSTVLHLNKSAFSDFAMRRPSENEVDQIYAATSPLRKSAAALLRESRTLTAIRDALLPKLVSGQIRVPLSDDVEERVGHVTEALATQS